MITRSLSHLARGERRGPVAGPTHKGAFPCSGTASRPGLPAAGLARERRGGREQAERATQSNNYWSASTYAPIPDAAWIVNFNNGNVNANNRTNNNYVRAVRAGT